MVKKISIVISAYNEEDNIQPLYQELTKYLPDKSQIDVELIFVNDGSSDHTLDKLLQLNAKDPRVKIVNFTRNFGHEIAMTAGMDYAQGDAVIFMDADLQHPPALLPEMIKAWQNGQEIVLTRRVDNKGQSFLHKMTGRLFYFILNSLSDVRIPENSPDFRLIDRKYIAIIKKMQETNRMFRGMLSWLGVKNQVILDFVADKRQFGTTKYSIRKLLRLARDSIVAFSVKPLRIALYLGLLSACLSLLIGIYFIFEHYILHAPNTGFATIVSLITFIGSTQLIVLGIIGEYIAKIHLEVKNRPLYVADYIASANH